MRSSLIAVLVLVSACEGVTPVKAHFTANNPTASSIKINAQGKTVSGVIAPRSVAEFDVTIDVPVGPSGSMTEPNDRTVSIPVSVTDLTLHKLTESVSCSAGARSITNIEYIVSGTPPNEYAYVNCGGTFNRVPFRKDTLAVE